MDEYGCFSTCVQCLFLRVFVCHARVAERGRNVYVFFLTVYARACVCIRVRLFTALKVCICMYVCVFSCKYMRVYLC